jgi:hypothetical protein
MPKPAHPQDVIPDEVCMVCNGSGEVEEVATDKQQIKVYKWWNARAEVTNGSEIL